MRKFLFILMFLILMVSVSAKYNYNEYDYSTASYDETVTYLSYSLSVYQEDLSQLGQVMNDIEDYVNEVSNESVDSETFNSVIVDLNESTERLNDALDYLDMKLNNLTYPAFENKSSVAISKYQDSKNQIETKISVLNSRINSLNFTFTILGHSQVILNDINYTRHSIRDVINYIYNQTSVNDNINFDSLTYQKLELNHIATPVIGSNVSSAAPSGQDLITTIETNFTSNLSLTTAKLYGLVKEAVKYTPYSGSMKGAKSTYYQRIGNDIDQASLLISLLRENGIHSRYVRGVIEVDIDDALIWFDTSNSTTLKKTLEDNGISSEINGNKIQLDHFWVTAYIGGSWKDLDPSYNIKVRDLKNTQRIDNYTTWNMTNEEFLDFISDINTTKEKIISEELEIPDLSGYTSIPASLEYTILSRDVEYSEIPDEYRHFINISLGYENNSLISIEFPTVKTDLVLIAFNITNKSEQIIDVMDEVPLFMIDVNPMIYFNDWTISSSEILVGENLDLNIIIKTPNREIIEKKTLISGFESVITIDNGFVNVNIFDSVQSNYAESKDSMNFLQKTANSLYLTGLNYFLSVDNALEGESEFSLINWWRPEASAVMTSFNSLNKFGVPLDLDYQIHIDRVHNTISVNVEPEQISEDGILNFMVLSGGILSTLEARSIEIVVENGTAIALPDLQRMADEEGIELEFAYNDTINSTIRLSTNLPDFIIDQIDEYVKEGYVVQYIPAPVIVESETYYGFAVFDINTGGSTSVIISTHAKHDGLSLNVFGDVFGSIDNYLDRDWTHIPEVNYGTSKAIVALAGLLKDIHHLYKSTTGQLPNFGPKVQELLDDKIGPLTVISRGTKFYDDIVRLYGIGECLLYSRLDSKSRNCWYGQAAKVITDRIYDLYGASNLVKKFGPYGVVAHFFIKYGAFKIADDVLGYLCDPKYDILHDVLTYQKNHNTNMCEFKMKYLINNTGAMPQKLSKYEIRDINPVNTPTQGQYDWEHLSDNDQKFGWVTDDFTIPMAQSAYSLYVQEQKENGEYKCHFSKLGYHELEKFDKNPCLQISGQHPAIAVDEYYNHVVYLKGDRDQLRYAQIDEYGNVATDILLSDVSGLSGDVNNPARFYYPDIIIDKDHNAHISVNFQWHIPYPNLDGETSLSFNLDYVAYYKINLEGEVVKSDVLEGYPVDYVLDSPLFIGLGYGYMYDSMLVDSRIGLWGEVNPIVTTSAKVFYPSQWWFFTETFRRITYAGIFGFAGAAFSLQELTYLKDTTYWDTLRVAYYYEGLGASPDENWIWDTKKSTAYSINPDLAVQGFSNVADEVISKANSLDGFEIAYLIQEGNNYKLTSTFAGDIAPSVKPWYPGLDYNNENKVQLVYQAGNKIMYKDFGEGTTTEIATSNNFAKPDLILDYFDLRHVVWINDNGTLSYSKSWDGLNWTEPVEIVTIKVNNFDIFTGFNPGSLNVVFETEVFDIFIQEIQPDLSFTFIQVKCPVDLHLYKDDLHSGLLPNGSFESQIPGVEYSHDIATDFKQFSIRGDTDGIDFVMEAFDSGFVNLSVYRTQADDGFSRTYYRDIIITNATIGNFSLNDLNLDYTLLIDFDGDGVIDTTRLPNYGPFVEINIFSKFNYNTTESVVLSGTSFDYEDGSLPIIWSSNVSGYIGTGDNITFNNPIYGEHFITATVMDSGGEIESDNVTISVSDFTDPVITINSYYTNNTNILYLDYSVNEPIRSSMININNGQVENLPTDDFVIEIALLNVTNGTYSFTLVVEDLAGNTDTLNQSFILSIDNYAPVLDFIEPIIVYRGELIEVLPTALDLDNDILTFTFNPPLNSSGKWQTTLLDTGDYISRVEVSDSELVDYQDVEIYVKDRPPIFEPISDIKVVTYGITIEFDINATDPEGQPVTYSMDGPDGASLVGNHFNWTPDMYQIRNHLITFYAFDGVATGNTNMTIAIEDEAITCSFDSDCGVDSYETYCVADTLYQLGTEFSCINPGTPDSYCVGGAVDEFVETCNFDCVRGVCTSIPTLEEIEDISVNESDLIGIFVNATDPEGDFLNYSINLPGFTVSNNILTWNTTFDDSGRYLAIVTVSDGFNIVTTQFTITVRNINRPPVIPFIPALVGVENTFFQYGINATDPDGDSLEYVLIPNTFSINKYLGQIIINPDDDDVGFHVLMLEVSDEEFTVNETFNLTVLNVNDAPTINFIPPQTAKANESFNYQVNADDDDGDLLSYSDDTSLFNISSTGLVQFTPDSLGNHLIEITVSDGTLNATRLMYLFITDDEVSIIDQLKDMNATEGDLIDLWGGLP